MTATEFKHQWALREDNLQPISLKNLEELNLKRSTVDFLTISGLPADAAPFLSFAKNIDDVYEGIVILPRQYDDLGDSFDRYVVIGSDGAGNPIAIDTSDNDKVVWLDHEDYFVSRYINSSIYTLAETLMAYHDFITEIIAKNGEEAFIDAQFDDAQLENLKHNVHKIDGQALMEDSFWEEELRLLLVNRQYYRSNK